MARVVAAILCALAVLTALPRTAVAHASLISSVPADGAMMATAPDRVTLIFNEPVSPAIVRLIAPDGTVTTLVPETSNATVALQLPLLGRGTHVLSWRVTSADGHPVGGSLLFSVGRVSEIGKAETATTGGVIVAITIARLALYAGLFFGIGGVFFRVWIADLPPSATPLIAWAIRFGLAALIPALGLQGADLLGVSLSGLFDPATWRAAGTTSFAATLLIAAIALLLALLVLVAGMSDRAKRYGSLLALVLGAAALAASGHASNAPPQWIMRPVVWLHAACIALWAGSLWPLYRAMRERSRAKTTVARFTDVIPMPFLFLLASGFALAVVQIDTIGDLPSSAYGKILIAKLVLVCAVFGVAGFNRLAFTPAVMQGNQRAVVLLGRTILLEIALVMAIFALVALWRFTPPPRVLASAEPAFVHIHDPRGMADLTLSPGRAGPWSATIKLMREDFTTLPARAVEIGFANPAAGIESFVRPAFLGPDGLWRVENLNLPIPGRWDVELTVLVSDFDRLRLDAPVLVGR
jgi:copper transport protein